jgi:quercetin dioxygenase-like cupin family protein
MFETEAVNATGGSCAATIATFKSPRAAVGRADSTTGHSSMALPDRDAPAGVGSGVGQCDFVSATGARQDASHHARAGAAAPSNSATTTTTNRITTDFSISWGHMEMSGIPFGTTDWSKISATEHPGEAGAAFWRTRQFGRLRVRMVEYSPGYRADHWCSKGHILLCLEGELHTTLEDGREFTLRPGMSYQVADNAEPHRSRTETGAKLFIVD